MTLKLVAIEGEPIPDASLADELANFTDQIEAGEHGDAVGVISAIVMTDGTMKVVWFGEDYSPYELMGLFEAAKLRVFADDFVED